VAAAGLRFDLLVRHPQLPAARRLAEAVEGLALVVDHGAKPSIETDEWEPWSTELARLAAVDGVHGKLSGLVTEARWGTWRADGVERYADRVLELFGPDRLMFGSDWPVCLLAASYAGVVEGLKQALGVLSTDDEARIFGSNAIQVYGLRPQ
jgi:L-fuconolactonase